MFGDNSALAAMMINSGKNLLQIIYYKELRRAMFGAKETC
jgi:hypothetical protein